MAVTEQPTLETLIMRCASGEAAGLHLLYERTSSHLFGLLKRILSRDDLAQEALQEVFVSVWRNASRYSERKGAAFTWMVSIARYRALDIKRSRKHEIADEHAVAAVADESDDTGDIFAAVAHDADVARLKDCMMGLQDAQRHAIGFAFLQGLTHSEAAERLGAPIGSVKSWIRRGLESLKTCLER